MRKFRKLLDDVRLIGQSEL